MSEQRVQRRLAAILVADVVGYNRMIREDESGTLAQINDEVARSTIMRYPTKHN